MESPRITFSSYGDLGDVIFLMPSMKLIAEKTGDPVTLYCKDGLRPWDPFTARIPLIAPLLETQDYIEAVLPWNGEPVDYDTCLFRDDGLPFGETLAARQAQWLQAQPGSTHAVDQSSPKFYKSWGNRHQPQRPLPQPLLSVA